MRGCLNMSKEKENQMGINIDYSIYKKKPIYEFFKRIIDFMGALIGIILLSWLFLILAILVKCTSKGPALYVSERIGRYGKTFKIYKFRSMRVGADAEVEELMHLSERQGTFKMKNDPRVTKFGKFLRKTSLDELPQLFNVLNGTMSIVGPRPCVRREVDQMSEQQKQRLCVQQGLTCIWQCSGRANTTFEKQMEQDLEYVQKRGFWFDVWMVLKTIPAVLFGKGAE